MRASGRRLTRRSFVSCNSFCVLPAAGAAFVPESEGFFWQGRAVSSWSDLLDRKIFEYRMENNAPRAARAYAIQSITGYDSMVACWDGKYT
jgi:hypothetical protein